MASSTLDLTLEQVPFGARIYLDAPIFIYHFTGASRACKALLSRCESGELRGVTSAVTVAEVTHRLMTVEAVAEGLVTPGNVVAKLRRRPDVVKRLRRYREQVEKIPLMGVRVTPLDLRTLLMAGALRPETGLLTNDSLAAATALEQEIDRVASADPDFEAVEGVTLHRPGDL